ncbi:MAG: VCBS repeat-containing protein, partial [candidate division WOR-3 bacterium]
MFFILLSSTALAILFPFPKFAQWNETSFRDFADGELDPALYISHRAELEPDSGCIEPALYDDVNRDGYYDLVSVDEYGPRMRIFLGSDSGYYPADSLEYSVGSGGNAIIADLNLDRWPELILSGHRMGNTTIYWGTPHGPSPINRTILVKHNGQNELIYVADLDRDGYLDILTGYAYTFPPGPLTIFWGSATGYSISNSSDIYVGDDLFMNLEVADFNHDGWSDIALAKEVG